MIRRLAPAALVVLLGLAAGAHANAQDSDRIVVLPGAMWMDDVQARSDLVEESAWLVQDFGGFEVFRAAELADIVGSRTADDVAECANVPSCYADELDDGDFDLALVVSIEDTGTEVFVQYQLVDLAGGALMSETIATLPTATSFAHLLVPCHDALRAARPGGVTAPIPAVVEVEDARQPTPPPVVVPHTATQTTRAASAPPPGPVRGPLGRTGRAVAFTGGGIVTVGILMGFAADDTQQSLQSDLHSTAEIEDLQSAGRTQQTVANIAIGLGSAAIVTGVTLVLVDRQPDDARRVRVMGAPSRVGISATW